MVVTSSGCTRVMTKIGELLNSMLLCVPSLLHNIDMSSFSNMLTDDERNELNALKNAIDEHPWSVHPDKMERFSELFVKTLPRQEQNDRVR